MTVGLSLSVMLVQLIMAEGSALCGAGVFFFSSGPFGGERDRGRQRCCAASSSLKSQFMKLISFCIPKTGRQHLYGRYLLCSMK